MSDLINTELQIHLMKFKKLNFPWEKAKETIIATMPDVDNTDLVLAGITYDDLESTPAHTEPPTVVNEEGALKKFHAALLEDKAMDERKKALQLQELSVREKKVQVDELSYGEKIKHQQKLLVEQTAIDTLNLDILPTEYLETSRREHEHYLEAAQHRLRCMQACFDAVVPLFPKNLLLWGAMSSKGKSHTLAEISACVLKQVNPINKKGCRVLVITNEENRTEFFTRVLFITRGWKYTRMDELTEEQRTSVNNFIRDMEQSNQMVVIDNAYQSISQATTSIEGIEAIFESIRKNGNQFDMIGIDYYQKVRLSKKRPGMNTQDVLMRFTDILDHYRKCLNSPIVVMTQLHPKTTDKTEFESRIKERKIIFEAATFAAEIELDRENFCTRFHIHKNRLVQGTVGTTVTVGFDKDSGRYVEVNPAFQTKILHWKRESPKSVEDVLEVMGAEKEDAQSRSGG
jgi:hypothetical protein